MAIDYPLTLPSPSLDTGAMTRPNTNIYIQFDQGNRIRRGFEGTPRYAASFLFESVSSYEIFRNFYEVNLLKGSLSFNASWEFDGELIYGAYRFTSGYSGVPLPGSLYKVNIDVEIISRTPNA